MLEVVNGIIRTPGEFYLEPEYVPYFVERVGAGHRNYQEKDSDGDLWSVCKVTKEDIDKFPRLKNVATVAVRYDFQYGVWLSWMRSCSYQKHK